MLCVGDGWKSWSVGMRGFPKYQIKATSSPHFFSQNLNARIVSLKRNYPDICPRITHPLRYIGARIPSKHTAYIDTLWFKSKLSSGDTKSTPEQWRPSISIANIKLDSLLLIFFKFGLPEKSIQHIWIEIRIMPPYCCVVWPCFLQLQKLDFQQGFLWILQ